MGINIGLEIINRYETNILNTAAQVSAGFPSGTRLEAGTGLMAAHTCMSTQERADTSCLA